MKIIFTKIAYISKSDLKPTATSPVSSADLKDKDILHLYDIVIYSQEGEEPVLLKSRY